MEGIEELVYQRLKSDAALSSMLCKFSGKPAIFYQLAPDDRQSGWENGGQCPRVVYDLDKQADIERKSSGTLVVQTFCYRDGIEPETLEPLVAACLKDVLINPDGGFPYCFAWARTIPFDIPKHEDGDKNRRIIGQEIHFDVIEYPAQETTDPDPVAALDNFLAEQYPEAVVVGLSRMGHFTEASAEQPVLYCRMLGSETESVSNTVVRMNARISVHVICSDPAIRLKLAADIQYRVASVAEIIMLDGSPMRPVRLSMNNTADYLKEGQIEGVYHYGVLRYRAKPHRITSANVGVNLHDPPYIEDYSRR